MKITTALITPFVLVTACGSGLDSTDSVISSERVSISALGVEFGSCSQDELKRFVAGESVPTISNNLSSDKQEALRKKLSKTIKISAERAEDALKSPTGEEFKSLLKGIFPASYTDADATQAFLQSVADNQMTVLEFISLYPTKELKINGLTILTLQSKLEANLLKMEELF